MRVLTRIRTRILTRARLRAFYEAKATALRSLGYTLSQSLSSLWDALLIEFLIPQMALSVFKIQGIRTQTLLSGQVE